MRISDWSSDVCSSDLLPLSTPISAFANLFVEPRRMARRLDYQEALRRPGTSPRMVASRSLLRPRPNLLYTARGRPVRAQRVVWREGEESRGSFCSLTTAPIFSRSDGNTSELQPLMRT